MVAQAVNLIELSRFVVENYCGKKVRITDIEVSGRVVAVKITFHGLVLLDVRYFDNGELKHIELLPEEVKIKE
ncbi:MAG: hypothetical protein IGBAC_0125 [Ignavibacteriae bacterium]|nr:MAG: hypothetical protein IGBAC_0125 [Ignavibacteriota bacterium]